MTISCRLCCFLLCALLCVSFSCIYHNMTWTHVCRTKFSNVIFVNRFFFPEILRLNYLFRMVRPVYSSVKCMFNENRLNDIDRKTFALLLFEKLFALKLIIHCNVSKKQRNLSRITLIFITKNTVNFCFCDGKHTHTHTSVHNPSLHHV